MLFNKSRKYDYSKNQSDSKEISNNYVSSITNFRKRSTTIDYKDPKSLLFLKNNNHLFVDPSSKSKLRGKTMKKGEEIKSLRNICLRKQAVF